jgi:arabinan endo-1,5-alpha-L-arabinosidase
VEIIVIGLRNKTKAAAGALSLTIIGISLLLTTCGGKSGNAAPPPTTPTVFSAYDLTGAITPVRDPSVMRQGSTYCVFGTDVAGVNGSLPIMCSTDRVAWISCGYVFRQMPTWVKAQVPGIIGLWAPDISYFNGLYHIYYAGSTFGSNTSVIGLATNTTLDQTDPNYQWVDQGEVLGSVSSDDFNAIDPTILADTDGRVWLTYGSYWSGIKQRQIDPTTGLLLASNPTVYSLAFRPNVQYDPIEGTSLVHKGSYYYLFASFDNCCAADLSGHLSDHGGPGDQSAGTVRGYEWDRCDAGWWHAVARGQWRHLEWPGRGDGISRCAERGYHCFPRDSVARGNSVSVRELVDLAE